MADKQKQVPVQVTCGDKCAETCEKVSTLCKVVGAVACGSLKLKTVKKGTSDVRSFAILTNCVGDYYKGFFVNHSNKKFLVDGTESLTFKECLGIYESVGNELRAGFGVNIAESVGICMRNMSEFLLAFIAATAVGCRAVPLNSLNKSEELEYVMTDAQCKVVFCDQPRMSLIQPFATKIGCRMVITECKNQAIADAAGAVTWEQVVANGKDKPKADTTGCAHEGDVMIMYTSGSTGKPKGVVHSNQSLGTALALQLLANLAVSPGDAPKILTAVPFFHITGLTLGLGAAIGGLEMHMLKKWDAGKVLDIIETQRITRFVGVPTMIRDLFEHPDFKPQRMASLKTIVGGGAAMPPALMAKMAEVTGKTTGAQGYGLTETCGGVIVNKGLDVLKFPASTGTCIPLLVKACVKDLKTGATISQPDQRGELCILSALNMTHYHNRPEDTEKAIDKEGWFHTGDIAKINPQGFVFILDRLKDVIIRGGENIDCTEVETAIFANPQVRECCIFGLPDERLGEVVGCAVFGKVTPQELHDFLVTSKKISHYKIPEVINIFLHEEELPKGATHKTDRKGLRERYGEIVKARGESYEVVKGINSEVLGGVPVNSMPLGGHLVDPSVVKKDSMTEA